MIYQHRAHRAQAAHVTAALDTTGRDVFQKVRERSIAAIGLEVEAFGALTAFGDITAVFLDLARQLRGGNLIFGFAIEKVWITKRVSRERQVAES